MVKTDVDSCFVRKQTSFGFVLPVLTKFSDYLAGIKYRHKEVVRKIFTIGNEHWLFYPEVLFANNNFIFSWTNDDKFLKLTVKERKIEYFFGDYAFSTEEVGSLDEKDYSQRLLEISLFYNCADRIDIGLR